MRPDNNVSKAEFDALKARFHGKMTVEEALATLSAAGDEDVPPILKINIAKAILDLRTGRSVQSAMARLRRATGLDIPRAKKDG
jgi:hypothetical protein